MTNRCVHSFLTPLLVLVVGVVLVGCQSGPKKLGSSYAPVGPTELRVQSTPVPEPELLDVAVSVFTSDNLSESAIQGQHTSQSIRDAEKHYMPQQLKTTLEASRHWGEVRVLPFIKDGHGFDVVVYGHIDESANGRTALNVTAKDATGRQWMKKAYVIQLSPANFLNAKADDPAGDLYRRIANDLAEALSGADPVVRQRIRRVSKLAFAARVSPEPFAEYLGKNPNGQLVMRHYPSDDDPAWQRINRVHGRDRVFSELVNKHYATYNKQMAEPYTGWRREIVSEREALQQANRSGWQKVALGAVLIGSAIALEAGGVDNAGAAKAILGIAGVQQVASGVGTLKQKKMHRLALDELTQSFSAAADPIVMDFEGRQVELKGTADEQYKKWQDILQELYREETGFPSDDINPAP